MCDYSPSLPLYALVFAVVIHFSFSKIKINKQIELTGECIRQ